MSLRVGVIGTGAIGTDHIRRINQVIKGARVTAVMDINYQAAKDAAVAYDAEVFRQSGELCASSIVDAVIVASDGSAHAKHTLEAVFEGKPVLCEKPLAETAESCKEIVSAEVEKGKKLVQVGFMRRYDKGYRMLKEAIDSGKLGAPLMAHCTHRNMSLSPPYYTASFYTSGMHITTCAIHEIDVMRWLLDDEYTSAQVIFPRRTSHIPPDKGDIADPQVLILMTEKGIYIELEIFFNSMFGYDINCEIVCESGTASLPQPTSLDMRQDAKAYRMLETGWKERFIDAYDVELQDWVDSALRGEINGPTAWDGYIASVTSDACLRAQRSGQIEPIQFETRPALYRST
ncbi:MAG: Gfo/Idh/MocA family protein [Christensenellaceae bacterium]|jgi:myo-inositol 2-dehydrogenase/D-chiro-inositol 1-dehydrogenase